MDNKKQLEKAKEEFTLSGYAQQVTSNPAYTQAMMVLRADLLDKFTNTSFKDVNDLLELKRQMDTVEKFQLIFERTMQTGRLAEDKISKLTKFMNNIRN